MGKANVIQMRTMIDAGKRYAAADRSDPFAFNRVMTHLNNGIASPFASKEGAGYYDAEEHQETRRLPDTEHGPGEEYQVTVYRNMKRV